MAIELFGEPEKFRMEVSKTRDWTIFTAHKISVRRDVEADIVLVFNSETFRSSRNGSKMRVLCKVWLGPEKDIVVPQSKVSFEGHSNIIRRRINMIHIGAGYKVGAIEQNSTELAFESVKSWKDLEFKKLG